MFKIILFRYVLHSINPPICRYLYSNIHRTIIHSSQKMCLIAQSFATPWTATLCNPMDCSLPDSSVHRILQARILKWVAKPSPRGSSWPRDRTQVSRPAGRFFTVWTTREGNCKLKLQWDVTIISHLLEWPKCKTLTTPNARWEMEQQENTFIGVCNEKWYSHFGRHNFLFFPFNFNWRIIALQCCVGFCHTTMWIGH